MLGNAELAAWLPAAFYEPIHVLYHSQSWQPSRQPRPSHWSQWSASHQSQRRDQTCQTIALRWQAQLQRVQHALRRAFWQTRNWKANLQNNLLGDFQLSCALSHLALEPGTMCCYGFLTRSTQSKVACPIHGKWTPAARFAQTSVYGFQLADR